MRTYKVNSFINKSDCTIIADRLFQASELEINGQMYYDAAQQFKAYKIKGGGYLSNIITYPQFNNTQLGEILKMANSAVVRLH